MEQTASLHRVHVLGLDFGSAAQLSKRPGSVWNCLWGNALKRSPWIILKSRVSYPSLGFLSSATWPSLPKKHYNGLNQTKPDGNLDCDLNNFAPCKMRNDLAQFFHSRLM